MKGKTITRPIAQKGATIPRMQPVVTEVDNGQLIPSLQPLPSPKGSGDQGGGQAQGGNRNSASAGASAHKK